MAWSIADMADVVERGLRARVEEDDRAQVVRGFDALDEVALHPLIHESLRRGGYGVYPEERYPADRRRRKRSEGRRCDVALTPDGRPLAQPDVENTLFEPPDAIALPDAFWLEIKVVAQFTEEGPNRRYSAELLAPVRRDVAKLARDEGILHAGVMLMLLVADKEVAENDLQLWHSRCLERGFPTGVPAVRHTRLTERIGHGCCSIAIFPVYHL